MSTIEKIRTLRWFAARPSHWASAAALVMGKFKPNRDDEECEAQATAWAKARSADLQDALRTLGYTGPIAPFEAVVGAGFMRRVDDSVAKCPVEMGGAGDLDLLYYACEAIAAKRVLETGVAYGWSSLAILTSLSKRIGSLLTSVDMPYPKRNGSKWVGVVVPDEQRSIWLLIREPDRYGLDKALAMQGGEIDLCHYDSDKSYYGRLWAYPRLWKALRPGGIFISDDIQDNLAFKEFTGALGVEALVVESQGKYVGFCVKHASAARRLAG